MANATRIAFVRSWTERHAHKSIKLAEDGRGRIWLRLEDLRQWMPGLTLDRELAKTHPSRVAMADNTAALYLEASAFVWLSQKSTSVPTLKLRTWLEANVLAPARRRHEWEDYRGRDLQRILRDPIPRSVEQAREVTESRMPWQSQVSPAKWLITRGQLSLPMALVVGLVTAILAVILSNTLDQKAWDVEASYRLWTWMGILVALWAVLWNGDWALGALRPPFHPAHETDPCPPDRNGQRIGRLHPCLGRQQMR